MRALARKLFVVSASFSAAVAVATILLIARSFGGMDYLAWDKAAGRTGQWSWQSRDVLVGRGGMSVSYSRRPMDGIFGSTSRKLPPLRAGWRVEHVSHRTAPSFEKPWYPRTAPSQPLVLGTRVHAENRAGNLTVAVIFPLWAVLVLSLLLPAAVVRSWHVRRRRLARGQCRACVYDVRASPGRCLECGAAAAGAVA